MSKIAPILAVLGMVLVTYKYPLYGMLVWSVSNVWLGWINRYDKGQLYMYAVYELFSIIGVYNYV